MGFGAWAAGDLNGRGDEAGPEHSPGHVTSIRWIRDHETDFVLDSQPATLIGRVVRRYGGFLYLFSDGTGTIELYSEISLPPKTPIVIRGEIDETTFDVESWRPTDKAGEVPK
jgi:uncharacterized protein YdeI (BOF family)